MRGSERFAERERESKLNSVVFEWLGARARARARAANAVGVPAGMFSLIADSGVILFVSGVSNLIEISNNFLSRRDGFCDTWDWNTCQ